MDVGLEVASQRGKSFVGGNLLFGALAFAQNRLGGFLIVPEIGVGNADFEGFQALAIAFDVKDNSEPA